MRSSAEFAARSAAPADMPEGTVKIHCRIVSW